MAVEMMVAVVVIAVKAALTRAADLKDYIFTQPKKKKNPVLLRIPGCL